MKYRTIYASALLEAIKGVCLSLEMSIDKNGVEVENTKDVIESLEGVLASLNIVRDKVDR